MELIPLTCMCTRCCTQQDDVVYVPWTGWLCPTCRILALAAS